MDVVIAADDPTVEDVQRLVDRHLALARQVTPAKHVHALDTPRLVDPGLVFFAARVQGLAVGMGALRRLGTDAAEIKSMHVLEEWRGSGIGAMIVDHLVGVAREWGCHEVLLETGTVEAFAPARRLYARAGFRPCPPFAEYTINPFSLCMRIDLTAAPAG